MKASSFIYAKIVNLERYAVNKDDYVKIVNVLQEIQDSGNSSANDVLNMLKIIIVCLLHDNSKDGEFLENIEKVKIGLDRMSQEVIGHA